MNERTQIQSKSETPSFSPLPSLAGGTSLLQRKCACGGTPGVDGQCTECRNKRLQADPFPAPTSGRQLLAHELSHTAEDRDVVSKSATSSNFGFDFSQIPIYAPATGEIQRRSAINMPGDEYEREADRIADRVAATRANIDVSDAPPRIQSLKGQKVGQADAAPASVGQALVDSPGNALEPALREDMERRFGHDFSRVRVHADARAAESARAVNAQAYTVGRDVVFGAGQFVPGTHAGKRLLAHELTHVLQQGAGSPVLQRQPAKKAQSIGNLALPWKYGAYSLFEDESAGIRFLVGVVGDPHPIRDAAERTVRAVIPKIGKQIAADNSQIKNPSSRVMTCFIVHTDNTRFALWEGNPVLVLDPSVATAATAAHEMGHAIFHALKTQEEPKTATTPPPSLTLMDAAKAANFQLRVADIYARLGDTKDFTEGTETHRAGHWIASPWQWGPPGSAKEHPWDDPDEFFASAKEAYQIDREGFKRAIARFTKYDPKVGGPAAELLALLDEFFKKGPELPPLRVVPEVQAAAAKSQLGRVRGVSKVEVTATKLVNRVLYYLLNPGDRPGP